MIRSDKIRAVTFFRYPPIPLSQAFLLVLPSGRAATESPQQRRMCGGTPMPGTTPSTPYVERGWTKYDAAIVLPTTFLLEVLGGAGAAWGCAEAFAVRDGGDNDAWRIICAVVGAMCLVRFVQSRRRGPASGPAEAVATCLLQVLGGAGAVWGCAEIVGLRVNYPSDCLTSAQNGTGNSWAPGSATCRNTYLVWRLVVLLTIPGFTWKWLRAANTAAPPLPRAVELAFSFVLEVMGGAGALWGAAEVAGPSGHSLRLGWGDVHFGQPSFDRWRIGCGVAFVWCLAVWLWRRVTFPAARLRLTRARAAPTETAAREVVAEGYLARPRLSHPALVEAELDSREPPEQGFAELSLSVESV